HALDSRLAARFRRRSLARIRIRAEIDLDHPGIAGHRARQAFGNLLAVIEHYHAVDHPHQHAHDVLDPDDGDAEFITDLAQHVGGLIHFVLVEPAEAFVGEQEFRPGRERLGQFELFQPGGPQAIDAGVAIGRKADHAERAFGGFIRLGPAVAALAVVARERHIFEHAKPVKRPRDLEGAADAAVDDAIRGCARDLRAIEHDRSRRRRKRARQHVEDRALARAVRADQAENLALLDPERHIVDSGEAAEALHQSFYRQHARTSAYSFAGFTGC